MSYIYVYTACHAIRHHENVPLNAWFSCKDGWRIIQAAGKVEFANVFYGIPIFQPTDYMYIVFCHMHWYFLCTQSCCQYKTSTIVNILPICHFIEIFTKTILWIIWLSRTYNISWIYIGSYSKTLPAACIVALMIQNFPHGWCGDKVAGFFIYSYCISTLDMDNGQTSLLLSINNVLSKCSCVPL